MYFKKGKVIIIGLESQNTELENIGFIEVRDCKFNDSKDTMFQYVEDEERFINAVSIECKK